MSTRRTPHPSPAPRPTRVGSVLALGLALLAGVAAARGQDPAAGPPAGEHADAAAPAPPRTLDRDELKQVLADHKDALKAGDAQAIARSLAPFEHADNPQLLRPLRKALDYSASKHDLRRAEEAAEAEGFGDDPDEIALRVRALEDLVRGAAARGLRGQGDERAGPVLLDRFEDGKLRRESPAGAAVLVDELAHHRWEPAVGEVAKELQLLRTREVARACVRYLGAVDHDDLDATLLLCRMLEPPSPANIHAGENPPEEYWKERWQVWDWLRKDVVEALRLRTGRTWASAEGAADGEGAAAERWVREHARELGLR